MINLSDVAKAHGTEPLFRDVSMQLLPGRRIALVGRNGSGKTTLLEIVLGLQDADAGTVSRDRGTRIGYLPQDVGEASTGTVLETVLEGAVEVMAIERRMRELEERITAADGEESQRLLGLYAHEQDRYTNLGGYGIEADAHRILSGLGFSSADAQRPVTELSGGWRVRAALARLLLADPDVLVLDEPTNHLDVETIGWLEGVLAQRAGAVLFTSHDRDFIDNVADRVAELAFGTVTEYVGGFADFVAQREMRLTQMQAAARNQQRQIEQTERFIERFRYKASKAKQVQSRVKSLDRVERIEVAEEDSPRVRFAFPEPQRSGRVVAELQGVSKSFGDLHVLDGVDLVLERGWKVAVVGPNGSGKSTLLRLLTGELTPDAGEVSIGHNVQPATFVQHQVVAGGQVAGNGAPGNGAPHTGAVLRAERSVLDEFTAALDDRHRGRNYRSMLGAFGFGEELAEQQVGALSGGEQTRLALARLMVSPVNLLCLDEPTNHLDIASRGILEDALVAFPGTVLLITHDRAVLRSVADHVLELSDGHARWFPGTYEEYLGRRERSTAGQRSPAAAGDRAPTIGTTPQDRGDRAAAKRAEAERRNALSAATRDLRREVERVERELERTEAEVAELTRELADPTAYDDKDRVKELVVRHGDAKDRAAELMTRWERAQHELERAESQATADFS